MHANILSLIARGEFAQAQALITEASAAGLITRETATRLTERNMAKKLIQEQKRMIED